MIEIKEPQFNNGVEGQGFRTEGLPSVESAPDAFGTTATVGDPRVGETGTVQPSASPKVPDSIESRKSANSNGGATDGNVADSETWVDAIVGKEQGREIPS